MKLGIDLGGTNLRVAQLGDDGTTLVTQHKEVVGERRDPATIVERLAKLIEGLAGPSDTTSVGVGFAGMLQNTRGHVANSPHFGWRDVEFGAQLATRLGARYTLGVYNDVNAIVWGEFAYGAAKGSKHALGVYVGTGIGGGLVVNGELVEGATNTAGEIGHVKVRWDDDAAPCACGQRGCVEAYVGGSYVDKRIQAALAGGATSSALELAGGDIAKVNPSHVDTAAATGDPWALELWEELAPLLAVALGNAVAVLNPERLVLGGGMLGRTPCLYELVVATLPFVAPVASMAPLQVVAATLGDDAGLVGAADLAARGTSTFR